MKIISGIVLLAITLLMLISGCVSETPRITTSNPQQTTDAQESEVSISTPEQSLTTSTPSSTPTPIEPPEITLVTPGFGSLEGNTPVSISGRNFLEGATVYFVMRDTSKEATNVFVSSDTQIFARTPPHERGFADVVVMNPDGGRHTLEGGFVYQGLGDSSEPTLVTKARVVRVIDGDTIEVDISGNLFKVRYIGVDTPEQNEFGYDEATQINSRLVSNRIVELEKDVSETDQYGRLLRYVYVDDVFVNAELVKQGYAQVATYPPDVKHQEYFLELQREAQQNGVGLWNTPEPIPTSEPNNAVNIIITKIFFDGLVPQVESDEYVEITNQGTEPVDLTGWVLIDVSDGYPSYTFPSYIIQPWESVRVYTNEIHPEYGGFSFGSAKAVWNNSDPDTAVLYDPQGNEVSRGSY